MRIFYFFFSLFLFFSCSDSSSEKKSESIEISIFCDAETIKGNFLVAEDSLMFDASVQSSDKSKSGKYSVKVDKHTPYGFTYKYYNIKEGDVVCASVWMDTLSLDGALIISGDGKEEKYYQRNSTLFKEDGDWGLIKSYFFAAEDIDSISIYVYNPSISPAYFDDLSIHIYSKNKKPSELSDALIITIPEIDYNQLKNYRKNALNQGVILGNNKKYVDGEVNYKGKLIPIKLRLKGDLADHLETNKWSFRIKIRGSNAFKGMKSFSIQHPSTRSFMKAWVAHKLFEKEDILTTRYKFITVIINGENKGVYAMEEHFDKQLLENRNRREGPILKFDESGLWENMVSKKSGLTHYKVPVFEAAEILPYKKGRTYRTSNLNQQFTVAKGHMESFRSHKKNVDSYFEIDRVAKYLAMLDVTGGLHSMFWNNQRHYFNPVTNKLEPIAFDCFGVTGSNSQGVNLKKWQNGLNNETLYGWVLQDSNVNELYIKYLEKFSKPEFLSEFLKEFKDEINKAEKLLQIEYPFYSFENDFLIKNCEEIVAQLGVYKKLNNDTELNISTSHESLPDGILLSNVALMAYTESFDSNLTILTVENFHASEIKIVGYSELNNAVDFIPLEKNYVLNAYNGKPSTQKLSIYGRPKKLFYKAGNCGDSVFVKKISKWPSSIENKQFRQTSKIIKSNYSGDTITFPKGVYSVSTDLMIPSGKIVVFENGVSIDFIQGAAFVSYSPVLMLGTKSNPIDIFSSDTTANGFTIIASGEEVVLNYVNFSKLNTMHKNNWILTGAVTIYEGDVSLNHCSFSDNKCEDAVNIIRSNFNMNNCVVSNTLSDGFDADYCTGVVVNSLFENTGNDCLDFSGSKIEINNCEVRNSGDKGISGGENSFIEIVNCTIRNTEIGIAAKDLSTIDIENISLYNCNYAFAAYRKKPEYGPATINVKSIKKNTSKKLYLLEKDSKLIYLEKEYIGKKEFNIDSMYVQFQ